jgi:RimJ/RimL family protein N-acetyltransferase
MESIQLAYMQDHEAEEVATLFRAIIANLTYYNELAVQTELEKYSAPNLLIKRHEDPYSIIVLKAEQKIIGYCFSRFDDYTVWLEWFGVAMEHRKKGLGAALLQMLEEASKERKSHKIWCDCRTDNARSKIVLENNGFELITEIKRHWYGQDFFLWQKFIQ